MSLSRTILSTQGDAFWLLPRPLSLHCPLPLPAKLDHNVRCTLFLTKLLFFVVKSCATPSCIRLYSARSTRTLGLQCCQLRAQITENNVSLYPLDAQSDGKIGSEHVVSFILVLHTLFCHLWEASSHRACDDVVPHTESSLFLQLCTSSAALFSCDLVRFLLFDSQLVDYGHQLPRAPVPIL